MTFERGDIVRFDITRRCWDVRNKVWVFRPYEIRGRLLSINRDASPVDAVVHTMDGAKRCTPMLSLTKVLPPPERKSH